MRFGTVAIIGRSNVGKSTLLNAALGEPLAIVSPLPQTTRDALLGVVTRDDAQIAFIDTPGMHAPKSELGRRMNAAAGEAARSTDVIVFMTDVTSLTRPSSRSPRVARADGPSRDAAAPASPLLDEDRSLILSLPKGPERLAVVNKVDLLGNKARLLPLLEALDEAGHFSAYVPISLKAGDGLARVLDEITALIPASPHGYDPDTLTDRPTTFFVREYIREQLLLTMRREVPHAVAITVDSFRETKHRVVIQATIHVEKAGQRAIIIGKGGERLRDVGIRARQRVEKLLGRPVHLGLFVRVSTRWKDTPRRLAELGYDEPGQSRPGRAIRRRRHPQTSRGKASRG
jgi:GTP-binding protein Era